MNDGPGFNSPELMENWTYKVSTHNISAIPRGDKGGKCLETHDVRSRKNSQETLFEARWKAKN